MGYTEKDAERWKGQSSAERKKDPVYNEHQKEQAKKVVRGEKLKRT
jgi:hypothetical protein